MNNTSWLRGTLFFLRGSKVKKRTSIFFCLTRTISPYNKTFECTWYKLVLNDWFIGCRFCVLHTYPAFFTSYVIFVFGALSLIIFVSWYRFSLWGSWSSLLNEECGAKYTVIKNNESNIKQTQLCSALYKQHTSNFFYYLLIHISIFFISEEDFEFFNIMWPWNLFGPLCTAWPKAQTLACGQFAFEVHDRTLINDGWNRFTAR